MRGMLRRCGPFSATSSPVASRSAVGTYERSQMNAAGDPPMWCRAQFPSSWMTCWDAARAPHPATFDPGGELGVATRDRLLDARLHGFVHDLWRFGALLGAVRSTEGDDGSHHIVYGSVLALSVAAAADDRAARTLAPLEPLRSRWDRRTPADLHPPTVTELPRSSTGPSGRTWRVVLTR